MVQKFIFLLFSIFLSFSAANTQHSIQDAIDDFVAKPDLEGAAFSICVKDVNTGQLQGAFQSETRLTPASVQKLVVTSAALDILGPEFKFETKLAYTGTINEQGHLEGDLIIIGGGDPSLGSAELKVAENFESVLNHWATAIKAAGISKINGSIIGDGSYYSGYFAGPGWPWEDLGNYYGAGVWGLNILENAFDVHFKLSMDKNKGPELMHIEPAIPNLLLFNELETGDPDSGDQAYIFGGPFSYKRWIRGSLPQRNGNYTIHGSIPDPAFFAAFHLREKLKESGIISQRATTQIDAPYDKLGLKVFHTLKSPTLATLVQAANYESINLYCEVFLRQIAIGEKTAENGLKRLEEWLVKKGFEKGSFILKDASGLAPQNAIAAADLTELIRLNFNSDDFLKSLPIGGVNGTAKYILKQSPAKGQVFVKSGSMSGVRAYAGILNSKRGGKLAFSIIANNFSCKSSLVRKEMEALIEQIYLY